MKKFFLITCMAISIVFLTSCSNYDEDAGAIELNQLSTNDRKAFEELRLELAKLDQAYGFPSAQFLTRRSVWGWFKLIASTIVADAAGGLVGCGVGGVAGAVVVGASASALVACNQDCVEFQSRQKTRPLDYYQRKAIAMDSLLLGDTLTLTKSDSVGYYHNSVIFALHETMPELNTPTTTIARMIDSVATFQSIYTDNNTFLTDSLKGNLQKETNDALAEYLTKCANVGDYDLMPSNSFWNNHEDEFDIIINFAENLASNQQNSLLYNYAVNCVQLVVTSSLTDSRKEALKSAMLIGFASSRLWKSEAILQQ